MISISQAQLIRGTKTLLDETSLTIYPGHKVGLVGANGTGKTSLLALILGKISLDKGDISFPSGWQIATVAQETVLSRLELVSTIPGFGNAQKWSILDEFHQSIEQEAGSNPVALRLSAETPKLAL